MFDKKTPPGHWANRGRLKNGVFISIQMTDIFLARPVRQLCHS